MANLYPAEPHSRQQNVMETRSYLVKKFAKRLISNVRALFAHSAPWCIWISYANTLVPLRVKYTSRYKRDKLAFKLYAAGKQFSSDWFTNNIPYWLGAIEHTNNQHKIINALEIGSWEG